MKSLLKKFKKKTFLFMPSFTYLLLLVAILNISLVTAANANVEKQSGGYIISNTTKVIGEASFKIQQLHLSKKTYEQRSKVIHTSVNSNVVTITMKSNTLLEVDPNSFVEGAFVKHKNNIYKGTTTFFIQKNELLFISDEKGNSFVTLYAQIDEAGPAINLLALTPFKMEKETMVFGQNGEIALNISDTTLVSSLTILSSNTIFEKYINPNVNNSSSKSVSQLSLYAKKNSKAFNAENNIVIKLSALSKEEEEVFNLQIVASDMLGNTSQFTHAVMLSSSAPQIEVFMQKAKEVSRLSNHIVTTETAPSFFLNSENNAIYYAIVNRKESTIPLLISLLNFKPYRPLEEKPTSIKVTTKQNLYYYAVNPLGNRSAIKKIVVQIPGENKFFNTDAIKPQ